MNENQEKEARVIMFSRILNVNVSVRFIVK